MTDKVVHPLDTVETDDSCPTCEGKLWIVDGDGQGKFWLLCMGVARDELAKHGEPDADCFQTRPIPAGIQVIDDNSL